MLSNSNFVVLKFLSAISRFDWTVDGARQLSAAFCGFLSPVMSNEQFLEEMEVLQAIYEDDIIVVDSSEQAAEIKITIHPNTADDEGGKFVCLTLHFSFIFNPQSTCHYPDKAPQMFIKNPRGLADSHLASIEDNLKSLAASSVGDQMLYSLIEYAKDSLTDNNIPSGECPICLDKFVGSETFFRTPCYHYFHKTCMKSYISKLVDATICPCPVCRFEFQIDPGVFETVGEMVSVESETFVPDAVFQKWRMECDLLFQKQKKNGGIIDLDYERNKFLLTTPLPSAQEDSSSTPAIDITTTPAPATPLPPQSPQVQRKSDHVPRSSGHNSNYRENNRGNYRGNYRGKNPHHKSSAPGRNHEISGKTRPEEKVLSTTTSNATDNVKATHRNDDAKTRHNKDHRNGVKDSNVSGDRNRTSGHSERDRGSVRGRGGRGGRNEREMKDSKHPASSDDGDRTSGRTSRDKGGGKKGQQQKRTESDPKHSLSSDSSQSEFRRPPPGFEQKPANIPKSRPPPGFPPKEDS